MYSVENECSSGVVGRTTKLIGVDSRTPVENWGEEGDTPVDEIDNDSEYVPEYHGTLEILWESGWTTTQG